MKKMLLSSAALLTLLIVTGCFCTKNACKSEKKCSAPPRKCALPCAKAEKCPLLGSWEFFVDNNGKLEALPVSPQPRMELCANGVLRFHYAKNDQPLTVDGKWSVKNGKIIISDKSGKQTQSYTILKDGTAEFTVGPGDNLPANTRVIIRKIK